MSCANLARASLLLAIMAALACSPLGEPLGSDLGDPKAWKRIGGPEHGISFAVPKGWRVDAPGTESPGDAATDLANSLEASGKIDPDDADTTDIGAGCTSDIEISSVDQLRNWGGFDDKFVDTTTQDMTISGREAVLIKEVGRHEDLASLATGRYVVIDEQGRFCYITVSSNGGDDIDPFLALFGETIRLDSS